MVGPHSGYCQSRRRLQALMCAQMRRSHRILACAAGVQTRACEISLFSQMGLRRSTLMFVRKILGTMGLSLKSSVGPRIRTSHVLKPWLVEHCCLVQIPPAPARAVWTVRLVQHCERYHVGLCAGSLTELRIRLHPLALGPRRRRAGPE